MTFKSDDYCKLDRNHTRVRAALQQIDTARKFNLLKYAEDATLVAYTRDGEKIEIQVANNLKKAIAEAGATFCIDLATVLQNEPLEEVNLTNAAAV